MPLLSSSCCPPLPLKTCGSGNHPRRQSQLGAGDSRQAARHLPLGTAQAAAGRRRRRTARKYRRQQRSAPVRQVGPPPTRSAPQQQRHGGGVLAVLAGRGQQGHTAAAAAGVASKPLCYQVTTHQTPGK
jgi:hypothetical protein